MVLIMLTLVRLFGLPSPVHAVELFAGCHSISNGIKAFGYSTAPRPLVVHVFSAVCCGALGCPTCVCIVLVIAHRTCPAPMFINTVFLEYTRRTCLLCDLT
jgi:hypothetical protein